MGARGGVAGSPGRGWVPQRRFQLFRCLKLAPAERCGHVTERRQSAPACLRVPAPNARRPEERRPRPGGRVRRPPGLEGRREGRGDAGTRGRRPAGGSAPTLPGSLRGRLPSGAAHVTQPVGDPLGQPWSPVQPSVQRVPRLRGRALRGPRPVQPRGGQVFIYLPDRLYGAGDTVTDRGVPSTVWWRGSTE